MSSSTKTSPITKPTRFSVEGYPFEIDATHWVLSREHTLNLTWVPRLLRRSLTSSFLEVLSHYACTYSSAHTLNQAHRFKHFAGYHNRVTQQVLDQVTPNSLINYRATLDINHEWYLGSLRSFLKNWLKLGASGLAEDTNSLLKSWCLRGNAKGRAVQMLCPKEGPLSDIEFEALHTGLIHAYETDLITLEDLSLLKVFLATGRRTAQIADLKLKDLIEAQAQDGLQSFLLNVPRRKQRGVKWRAQFKAFALSSDLGILLKELIKSHEPKFQALFGKLFCDFEELPLFPDWHKIRHENGFMGPGAEVGPYRCPWAHYVSSDLGKRIDVIVSKLEIHSERTGKPLRILPIRLRRTLATRAAREGFGELIIAELLDHSDTQNARVYTENVPEHIDAINMAVAKQLAPLAQAFAGVIKAHERDAIRGDDLSSRIKSEGANVGTCGHYGFCGALSPIACYTCRSFQAWVDGPHEQVLTSLLKERDRILAITQDKVMAAINDRTILAVTQVVQICEKRRNKSKELVHHG